MTILLGDSIGATTLARLRDTPNSFSGQALRYLRVNAAEDAIEYTATSVISNTLDEAYDEGGAGAGRQITVDAGAVKFESTGGNILEVASTSFDTATFFGDGRVSINSTGNPSAFGVRLFINGAFFCNDAAKFMEDGGEFSSFAARGTRTYTDLSGDRIGGAFQAIADLRISSSTANFRGCAGIVEVLGVSTQTITGEAASVYGLFIHEGSLTLTTGSNFHAQGPRMDGTATITNFYPLHVDVPSGGGGTIVNWTGLRIEDPSVFAGTIGVTRAIHVLAGLTDLDGSLEVADHIGLGTTFSATFGFIHTETFTETSGSRGSIDLNSTINPGSAATGTGFGIDIDLIKSGAFSQNTVTGIDILARNNGSGDIINMHCLDILLENNSVSNTVTNAFALDIRVRNLASGGTLATARAINIAAPSNSGTMTTYTSLDIADPGSVAATTKAIQVRGGLVDFDGNLEVDGFMGLGIATNTNMKLRIANTFIETSGIQFGITQLITVTPSGASTGETYGVNSSIITTSANDHTSFRAIRGFAENAGTGTLSAMYGTQVQLTGSGGPGCLTTNVYGVRINIRTTSADATFTNAFGIDIFAPGVTGTITNYTGIRVGDPTGLGIGTAKAIHVLGGLVDLDDNLEVDGFSGFGRTAGTAVKLGVSNTFTGTSGVRVGIDSALTVTPSGASTGQTHGVNSKIVTSSANAHGTIIAIQGFPDHNGTGILTNGYCANFQLTAGGGAGCVITNAYGTRILVRVTNASAVITNAFGIDIQAPGVTGTMTNYTGIRVGSPDGLGIGTAKAIHVKGGLVDFDGDLEVADFSGFGRTASTDRKVGIQNTYTNTSGVQYGILSDITASPSGVSSGTTRGIHSGVVTSSANNHSSLIGFFSAVQHNGTATVTSLLGMDMLIDAGGGVGCVATNAFGVRIGLRTDSANATITNGFGIDIVAPTVTGTFTNYTAIRVGDPTAVAGTAFAIDVLGGQVRLTDNSTGIMNLLVQKNVSTATVPVARIVQDATDGSTTVLELQQDDVDEAFLDFIGSDRGVIAGNTASVESIRVRRSGSIFRIALYADA